jgi:tetraacyldisaccharide 4'-kinase
VLKSYELGARTISVGNLTTGGTGKTPLVALIARLALEDDDPVCILTRGYGRKDPKSRVLVSDGNSVLVDADTGGDEPTELAHQLNGRAIIIADPDRVAAAKWAHEKFAITTFILDDGFQHRRARRHLDIVCIDATNPCGNGQILPAGSLRESFKSLNRADAIVITRTEQVDNTADLEMRLRKRNASAPIFRARTELRGLVPLKDFHAKTPSPQSIERNLLAFSGIGNPDNFFASLDIADIGVTATKSFPDHHRFTQTDITALEAHAGSLVATALVTTAKDAVKLKGLKFEIPCYVAMAETVLDDSEGFEGLILSSWLAAVCP